MNDKKKEPETVAEDTKPTLKFPLAELRKRCEKLFGVTKSVFDGVTHDLDGNYTVDAMKKRIDNWMGKTAEPKGGK